MNWFRFSLGFFGCLVFIIGVLIIPLDILIPIALGFMFLALCIVSGLIAANKL